MILVDTSVWIEFFRANSRIFPILQSEIESQNILAAESVFGELLQGAKNKREQDVLAHYWQNLPKRSETDLWIKAGLLSAQNRFFAKGVGLIDTFLIVFAREYRCQIWTLDKKLASVLKPEEIFLDKAS